MTLTRRASELYKHPSSTTAIVLERLFFGTMVSYSLLPSLYPYVISPVLTSMAAAPAMNLDIFLSMGENLPINSVEDVIPTQASLGIIFPSIHQTPEEHSVL
jgi:hypothetical protein